MVVRVIVLTRVPDIACAAETRDDAAGAAAFGAWGGNGIFAIVPSQLCWQPALEVAEYRSVLSVGERPPTFDKRQCLLRFARQRGERDVIGEMGLGRAARCAAGQQCDHNQQYQAV